MMEALARDFAHAMEAAGAPQEIPTKTPPRVGSVLAIESGYFVKEISFSSASVHTSTAIREAASAALGGGTWAIVVGPQFCLASDSPEVILRTLRGSQAAWQLAEAVALGYSRNITPTLSQRISVIREELQAYAGKEGYKLDPVSLTRRAHAKVFTEITYAALRVGSTTPLTDDMLRRAVSRDQYVVTGGRERETRPASHDWRALYRASGLPMVHQRDSMAPYPPREVPLGHVKPVCCHSILQAMTELDGPPAPDDPELWGVLDALYQHRPNFTPSMSAAVERAAKEEGRALIFPPAQPPGEPLRFDPHADDMLNKLLPAREAMGVLVPVTPEVALAPGNAVSGVKCVAKGDFFKSPADKAAIEGGDLEAIGALAEANALRILARAREIKGEQPGLSPPQWLEYAIDEFRVAPKLRLVVCGGAGGLSDHIECGSFTLPTAADVLADATTDSKAVVMDMASFYYAVGLHVAVYCWFFVTYAGKFWLHKLMCMGTKDSALVSCMASGLIVWFAARYGCRQPQNYIDDHLLLTNAARQESDTAALRRAAEVVVPGGISEEKFRPAARQQVMLGLLYDFDKGEVGPTPDRLWHYGTHVFLILACLATPGCERMITTSMVEKTLGKLSFLAQSVMLGRIHLRALYAMVAQNQAPFGYMKESITKDLQWWGEKFRAGTLRPMRFFHHERPMTLHATGGGWEPLDPEGPRDAHPRVGMMRSDAGEGSGAAIHEGEVTFHVWEGPQLAWHSDLRELYALLKGVERHDAGWRGKRMVYVLDHSGNCACLNKGSARSPAARDMIDALFHRADKGGYSFVALYCPRESNEACDRLSKHTCRQAAERECAALGLRLG